MTTYAPRPGEVETILDRAVRMRRRHAGVAVALALTASVAFTPVVTQRAGVRPVPGPAASPPASRLAAPPRATPSPGTPSARGSASPAATAATGGPAEPAATASPASCAAGANGGATDRGVGPSDVALFSAVVQSGTGAAAYGPNRIGANAAKNDVNRAGGICGRTLALKLVDDGWDAARSFQYIRTAVERERVFALPWAGPIDGLRVAAGQGYLTKTRTPVVTGLPLDTQDDWVLSLDVSPRRLARAMARDAYAQGARTFGVVFDDEEVGEAYDAEVRRLTGQHVEGYGRTGCSGHYCHRGGGQQQFYERPPDFVALLTSPATAVAWLTSLWAPVAEDAKVPYGHALGGMLSDRLHAECGGKCEGLRAWSAYKARCGYATDPALRRYEDAVRRESSDVDVSSPGLMATYAAFEALAAAMRDAGPVLTREAVHAALVRGVPAALTVAGRVGSRSGTRTVRVYSMRMTTCVLGPVVRV